jgi:hypothetical protein
LLAFASNPIVHDLSATLLASTANVSTTLVPFSSVSKVNCSIDAVPLAF